MANVTVYVPDALLDEYKRLRDRFGVGVKPPSHMMQKSMEREVKRIQKVERAIDDPSQVIGETP